MSQQVSFYLTPQDVRAAEERIHECGDFVVLHSRSRERKPRIVPNINFVENGKQWLFFYLARPVDVPLILMHEVPKQNYWAIDSLRSPIIEFSSSYFDGNQMRRGRLYFQTRFYSESGQLVTKDASFLNWAKLVLSAVKKTLVRDSVLGAYIGPDARKWSEQGGILLKSHE